MVLVVNLSYPRTTRRISITSGSSVPSQSALPQALQQSHTQHTQQIQQAQQPQLLLMCYHSTGMLFMMLGALCGLANTAHTQAPTTDLYTASPGGRLLLLILPPLMILVVQVLETPVCGTVALTSTIRLMKALAKLILELHRWVCNVGNLRLLNIPWLH